MFQIDDEKVIDATWAGSIAHLINDSCEMLTILFGMLNVILVCVFS